MQPLEVAECKGGLRLRVRVKPRASRTRTVGVEQGELVVAVAAPPNEGQANQELLQHLARTFKVAKTHVCIDRGASSRHKLVQVRGLTIDELATCLNHECGVLQRA